MYPYISCMVKFNLVKLIECYFELEIYYRCITHATVFEYSNGFTASNLIINFFFLVGVICMYNSIQRYPSLHI